VILADYVVGSVDELTLGSKRIVDAGGVEIGVFNVNGTYHALPNHCFHQGGPVCEGNVGATIVATQKSGWRPEFVQDGEIVVCPWHGMEFNITTGRCLSRGRARLRKFRVRVVDGQVTVTV
jgi:nitrite reductase/ring-hydroxylating ferredoxin subunit